MKPANLPELLPTICLFMALPFSNALADENQVYLEENGYVHFEAEDAELQGDWEKNATLPGHTGSGYLEWAGADYFSENSAGNGVTTYHFTIETAGNYEFRWRSRIAKGDSNTESNDSWLRFDTGDNVAGEEPLDGWTKVYMGELNMWSWSSRTVDHEAKTIRQYLSEGNHTLAISGRSYGHAIDRIVLYRYADVSFDAGLNDTLPLSRYQKADGTTIDPNPIVYSNIRESETTSTESVPANRLNVEYIAVASNVESQTSCENNTLTLSLAKAASVSIDNGANRYSAGELVLMADSQQVLLSYDLSEVPVFSSASLRYSTGAAASNGAMTIHLGSHSHWPDGESVEAPSAQVLLADAQGGWETYKRYGTSLDSTLLPLEITTFILSATTGSESLALMQASDNITPPELVLTGGSLFCTTWEANLNTADAGHETTDEVNSEEAEEGEKAERKKSGGGGVTYWLAAWLLVVFRRRRGMCPTSHSRILTRS